jgi:hypothetical protein
VTMRASWPAGRSRLRQDRGEPDRVHEGHLAQVEDDPRRAGVDCRYEALAQLGRGGEIELAREGEHEPAEQRLLGESERRPLLGNRRDQGFNVAHVTTDGTDGAELEPPGTAWRDVRRRGAGQTTLSGWWLF